LLPADTRDLDGDSNITETIPFDIVCNPRINGTTVDIGAFEFTTPVNQPPVITNKTFTIAKSIAVGATVGTVPISDPENNPFTVTITNGNTDTDNDGTRPFAISNSGVITVTDPGDFGTNTSFNLTVTANDGNATGNGAIVVNLTNPVNRPPVVNDAIFSISKTSPNGTVVGTINATDADNNPLTYNITAGNPNLDGDGISAFTINNSGQIAMADSDDKAVVISLP